MTLSRLNLILVPSVLVLASPALAEAGQANAKLTQSRPLNLSLPRDVQNAPGTGLVDETVQRNLRAPAQDSTQAPARLRYGAGYEHRHQEMGAGAAVPGGSADVGAGSGTSTGRRGR